MGQEQFLSRGARRIDATETPQLFICLAREIFLKFSDGAAKPAQVGLSSLLSELGGLRDRQ
jgi:hypothetical protein